MSGIVSGAARATMPEEPYAILGRIQEFQRTFEQNYGRKMTDEEKRVLEAAREIIRQRLGPKHREKAAD